MTSPLAADICGAGPPVVLLHGQPGSAADWSTTAPLLGDRFLVVAPDRPGWGRTGGRPGGFAANAAAVAELLASLGPDVGPAVAVGHSWGGVVALALAARRPDLVAGVVLVASVRPGEPIGLLDRLLGRRAVGEAVAALGFEAVAHLLAMRPVRAWCQHRLRAPELAALTAVAGPPDGAGAAWRSFAVEQEALISELDAVAALTARVTAPCAVVCGSADRVVPAAVGARLAGDLDATLHLVAGAGHLLPLDHPERVAAAVDLVARRAGLLPPASETRPEDTVPV